VLRRLASRGTREAFLAVDDADRRVVLKVLGAPHSGDGLLDPKIADEASSYARLSHPNLVKVVELFSEGGRLVIALENVEGSTLNVVRAALGRGQHKLDDACWVYVAYCIFAGLAAAHAAVGADGKAAPVVHGNINPSCVHVAWDGAIKLGDFGVASVGEAARDSNPGFTWGSHGYAAPEQANAQPASPQADVYSATLVLWEMLAGRKAIERSPEPGADFVDRTAAPAFPSLGKLRPDIDERVRDIVRAGLQPDPAKRSVDAARVCEILRGVTDMDTARQRFATALAGIRSASEIGRPPAVAAPRRPPPVPPRRRAATKPPLPLPRPIFELELDIEPDPESTRPTSVSPPAIPGSVNVRIPSGRTTRLALLAAALLGAGLTIALSAPRGSASAARRAPAVVEAQGQPAIVSAPAAIVSAPEVIREPPAEPAPAPTAPTAATTANAANAPTAAAPDDIPPDVGELQMPPSAAGHRIFVDGRTVSEGLDPVRVPCGPHAVRIGSAGQVQRLDVPCGAALVLTR
jgi:serine/threonine protein kinase